MMACNFKVKNYIATFCQNLIITFGQTLDFIINFFVKYFLLIKNRFLLHFARGGKVGSMKMCPKLKAVMNLWMKLKIWLNLWAILWMKKLTAQSFLMMQGIIVPFLANDLKWHLAQFWLLLLMQGGLYLL